MPTLTLTTVTLSSPDPAALAAFWASLLGWQVAGADPGEDWFVARDPAGGVGVACQLEDPYVPPVWPAAPGSPQMQVHLEVRVDDLEQAVAHAVACGAAVADVQPQDDVRVCLDPDGHPFCLWVQG